MEDSKEKKINPKEPKQQGEVIECIYIEPTSYFSEDTRKKFGLGEYANKDKNKEK